MTKRIPVRLEYTASGYRLTTYTIPPVTVVGKDLQEVKLALIQALERAGDAGDIIVQDREPDRKPSCCGPFSREAISVLQRAVALALQDGVQEIGRKHLVAACQVKLETAKNQCPSGEIGTPRTTLPVDAEARDVLVQASAVARRESCKSIDFRHLQMVLLGKDRGHIRGKDRGRIRRACCPNRDSSTSLGMTPLPHRFS